MVTLTEAASNIQQFEHGSLTSRIATLEGRFRGADKRACELLCSTLPITGTLLESAFELKRAAAQVHVIIHTLGILLSLCIGQTHFVLCPRLRYTLTTRA